MKRIFQAKFNGFQIDSDQGLFLNGSTSRVPLHPKELAALCLLVQRNGKLVTKEDLVTHVWNGAVVSDDSITRCISVIKAHLRRTFPGSEQLIQTEYGRGYRFTGQIEGSESFISEESFYALINASSDLIALKDGQGRWQVINQIGLRIGGLATTPWQGCTNMELANYCRPEFRSALFAGMASDESAWTARKPIKTKVLVSIPGDGTHVFHVTKSPIYHIDGSRHALVIVAQDLTASVRAEQQNSLSAQVLANSQEAVMITDADNCIISINHAFTAITGYAEAEVLGKAPGILGSGRHPKEFYQAMWHTINKEGTWRGEIWDRRKNGEIYPKWLDISVVRNRDGELTNYIAIFSDITERKATAERLEFMAYHDPLTALPNRTLLRDRFELATASASRNDTLVALMFLDLDQFKHINDSLGHELGDQLLLSVAIRLQDCVRETDTVSRLGGDEFVVLLTDIQNISTVTVVAQKILDQLSQPFQLNGQLLSTSFSIGICLYPDDATDFSTLLKLSDAAMYYAKDCGRNTYRFYTEQMNVNTLERLHLQNSLYAGLQRGEFTLCYQPQFAICGHQLVGIESLIRWNSSTLGEISPAKFIPVAEDTGLIVQIGEWVLYESCRQNKAWQDAGFAPVTIAVNISAIQFKRGDIVETVSSILNRTGLDPAWLELELTESILIQDVNHALEIVNQLRAIGVKLSIDDFGTGYSSLAYLKRFAVHKLKIDQSFIRNLTVDPDDAAIVHSVIQLGHSMKMRTIAEGVETEEQADFLIKEQCDEVQGYLYSHPLSPQEILQFMRKASTSVK